MSDFPKLSEQIALQTYHAETWMRGRQIETEAEAAEAEAFRADLATLKGMAEKARDDERLPLIAKAQDIQAKYAPRILQLKKADDLVRHGLNAWRKAQKKAQGR